MAKHIGIVGSGFAGLHLALLLQQHGVETTLYSERSPQQIRSGPPALLARWASTLDREQQLGVNLWDGEGSEFSRFDVYVDHQPPLQFSCALSTIGSLIDPRLYLSRLQEVYVERGGNVLLGNMTSGDLTVVAEDHDVIVVASGRDILTELFPPNLRHSPFRSPARHLTVGLFEGFATPDENSAYLAMSPGHGEIIHGTILTEDGLVPGILFEGVPGGDFDSLNTIRYIDNPAAFHAAARDVLRRHAPHWYEYVDRARFRVISPRNVMQGAITPIVRKAYASLGHGKYAIAVGDAHVLTDPLNFQGANTASQSAWTLGHLILERDQFDLEFARAAEAAMWDYAQHIVNWSTLMLKPVPPHVLHFIDASTRNASLASIFVNTFHQPRDASVLLSATATEAMIASYATQ